MNELKYVIEQDEVPTDPREWDNLGTMHCWHSRYNLGDEQHSKGTSDEFFFDMVRDQIPESYFEKWNGVYEDSDEHKEQVEKLFDKTYICLSLYLYDHSGLTISTGSFSCPWDSGQIGWIIVSIEKIKKEYDWKVLTKKRRKQIEKYLRSEVETYDQYLTGDVWGYIIQDEDGNEDYDSCWGYFGQDDCIEAVKLALQAEIEYQKKHWKQYLPNVRAGECHL